MESGRDPKKVGDDKKLCERLMLELEPTLNAARATRAASIMGWVQANDKQLSLTPGGSRLVQKTIEVSSVQQREHFAEMFFQDTMELYTSPHANHVLARLIEVMPPARLSSIVEAIRGKSTTVARNQFGCRILERLIEHCDGIQAEILFSELLEDLEALARHQFGNFVVQHLFEHGTSAMKHACVQTLLPHILQHATHKTASNVVQCMLEHADLTCQAAIADALLAGEGETSLETIATTHYGSFVVQRLVDRLHPRIAAVKTRIRAARPRLQESRFSQKKIVEFLGEAFFR